MYLELYILYIAQQLKKDKPETVNLRLWEVLEEKRETENDVTVF